MSEYEYRARITRDDDPMNPREWDNLGTMVCWHDRYRLGDEQPRESPDDWIEGLVAEHDERLIEFVEEEYERILAGLTPGSRKWREALEDLDRWKQAKYGNVLEKHYIMLPLHLYDHGGITMSTGSFSCPWDSGQVGWVYVDREKAFEGRGWKRWSSKRRAQIATYLESEVETYAQYLEGDVWGFEIERRPAKVFDEHGEEVELDDEDLWEHDDSCWGFYGDDIETNGMLGHAGEEHRHLLREVAP